MKRRKFLSSTLLSTVPFTLGNSKVVNFLTEVEFTPRKKIAHSSMSLTDLYKEMEQLCTTTTMGCAINTNWLIDQTLHIIRSSVVVLNKLDLQTSHPLIKAGIKIETSPIKLTVLNGDIYLDGFTPTIILKDPNNQVYNSIPIVYEPVKLKIDLDVTNPDKLRFYIVDKKPKFNIPDTTSQIKEDVVKPNFTIDEFKRIQSVFLLANNAIALLDVFVGSIPFPPILQATRTFTIQTPYEYSYIENYIIIKSKYTSIWPKDDCGGADGFVCSTLLTPGPLAGEPGKNPGVGFEYHRNLETLDHGHLTEDPELNNVEFAFYYPTEITFKPLAIDTLKPAIVVGDEGSFLAFKWFYKITANLFKKVDVVLDVPTKTLKIDFPMQISGNAGIGMEIACVYVPVASLLVDGEIDPNHIELTLNLTRDGNGVALYAKPNYNASVHVRFENFFRLEVILNILMGSIGNRLVSNALKNAVNKLNFKLFDFTNAELTGPRGWNYTTLAKPDSLFAAFASRLQ